MSVSHSGGEICLQFSGVVEAGGRKGSAGNQTAKRMDVDGIKKTKD